MQCFAKHTRGAWLVGHDAVQAVWKQAGEEAGSTARVDVAHGIPREFHTTGRIFGSLFTPYYSNLRGVTSILAEISMTHPFVRNAISGVRTRKRVCTSEHR